MRAKSVAERILWLETEAFGGESQARSREYVQYGSRFSKKSSELVSELRCSPLPAHAPSPHPR
jgi:hypothetical protein